MDIGLVANLQGIRAGQAEIEATGLLFVDDNAVGPWPDFLEEVVSIDFRPGRGNNLIPGIDQLQGKRPASHELRGRRWTVKDGS